MNNNANDAGRKRADAALDRMARLHPKLIDLGLDRSRKLLTRLGNPEAAMPPVIHIAGTNGKGSTLAFLSAMCRAAGKRTHAYTSPHLVRFNERIRLDGKLITDGALADILEEVETANGDDAVTFFEVTTSAAMLAFARKPADITLLEVGLGGRVDSTNVVSAERTIASVITPIAKDHEHFLGNTLPDIAREKAGIMREGVAVFSSMQDETVLQVFRDEAKRIGADLHIAGEDFDYLLTGGGVRVKAGNRAITIPDISLTGKHQAENCALAAATIMHSIPEITDEAIINGAAVARWPGRITRIETGTLADIAVGIPLWLDGAHNSHGALALANALDEMEPSSFVLICGALNTREPKEFLTPLSPHLAHIITLTIPDTDASLTKEELRAAAITSCDVPAETADNIIDAMRTAAAIGREKSAAIIISGSLYLGGHALGVNGTVPD